jgi:hypothetical protein
MRFDYGDEVIIRTKDGSGNVSEKRCAVVGITHVENEEQAAHFKYPIGTVLYTVEFGDGTDALAPEDDLLEAGPDKRRRQV